MVVKCEQCKKEFTKQFYLERHKNRKNPCVKTESKKNHFESCKNKCPYCGKIYSSNSNYNRHVNSYCKIKKTQEEEKEEIFKELVSEIKELRKENRLIKKENKQIKTRITNNNTNNGNINYGTINNNNIKVIAFGKEDLDYISKGEWLKLLKSNYKSIEELTKKVHFDKNRPEHHNIYIPNLRSKYIMIHDGDEWKAKDRKDTIDDLYEEKAYIIFNKVDELKSDLPLRIESKFNEIKDKYDDKKIKDALLKDLDLTLYNQRKIPIYTSKKRLVED